MHYAREPQGVAATPLCGTAFGDAWTRDALLVTCPRCLVLIEWLGRCVARWWAAQPTTFADETYGAYA